MQRLRADFLTGLAVVLPAGLTVMLLTWAVRLIDRRVLPLIPFDLPFTQVAGAGIVVFGLITIVVGALLRHMLGQRAVRIAEGVVSRVPVARQLYVGAKQLVETAIAKGGTSFRQTCLIEYPERGDLDGGRPDGADRGRVAAQDRRARSGGRAGADSAESDHRLSDLRAAAGPDSARPEPGGRREAGVLGGAGRAARLRAAGAGPATGR